MTNVLIGQVCHAGNWTLLQSPGHLYVITQVQRAHLIALLGIFCHDFLAVLFQLLYHKGATDDVSIVAQAFPDLSILEGYGQHPEDVILLNIPYGAFRQRLQTDGSLVFENVTGVKGLHRGAQVYSELNLEIKGTATLNNPNADYGILLNSQQFSQYEDPSDLTFSGDNTNIKISAKNVAIYACSVNMSGGSVEAKASSSDGQGLCLYHRAIFNKGSLVVSGGTNSISDFVYVYGGSFTAVGTLSGKPALSAQVIQNIGGDLSFTAKGSSYGLITDGVYNYAGSLYAS